MDIAKNLTAVVPVREGSRRLPNKNIVSFADTNLLLYKIRQLKKVAEISRIIVSSDSTLMLKMAADVGVETHRRAPEFCDEKTKTFGEVVEHIAKSVEGDHILWATCTSPLVTPHLYQSAIEQYYRCLEEGNDSLAAFKKIKRYIWNDSGPINYKLGKEHVPSQELPDMYVVTDGILLAPRDKMIEWSYFHGPNPFKFFLDKRSSVDIDDGLDLAVAKAWLDMDEDGLK